MQLHTYIYSIAVPSAGWTSQDSSINGRLSSEPLGCSHVATTARLVRPCNHETT